MWTLAIIALVTYVTVGAVRHVQKKNDFNRKLKYYEDEAEKTRAVADELNAYNREQTTKRIKEARIMEKYAAKAAHIRIDNGVYAEVDGTDDAKLQSMVEEANNVESLHQALLQLRIDKLKGLGLPITPEIQKQLDEYKRNFKPPKDGEERAL